MNVLYHLTVLPPKIPEAEALSQEIASLRRQFSSDLVYLNPNVKSKIYLPRLLFGLHCLKSLRIREQNFDLHHLYNPDPFPFPILRWLRRPAIYTISSGVGKQPPNMTYFSRLAAVSVPDERSFKQMRAWGVNNCHLVRPGIDTERFGYTACPLKSEVRLLVGSAPWTKAQFHTKGIEALLQAAQQSSRLKLIFLWRGVLAEEMDQLVQKMNLSNQVTVLNKLVDVNQILADVHGTITLASAPGIIKSYPHSLLDSLAAGKPVIVSDAIPMADYVRQTGCGEVATTVTPQAILEAVEKLIDSYVSRQRVAHQVGQRDFSQQTMIAAYRQLYQQVLEQHAR